MKPAYSIKSNLIIKESLPKRGILCSNPARAERLASRFADKRLICDAWGVKVYSVKTDAIDFFLGYVPMGAAGSAMGYFEAYVAGAETIVRYGSDDSVITSDDLNSFTLVECADNLVGIPAAIETEGNRYREVIEADKSLVDAFKKTAQELHLSIRRSICHHIEDYHAYRFPELMGNEQARLRVQERIESLEARRPDLHHCRDMESAALFFRAKQLNKKAITILQSVLKPYGDDIAYTGSGRDIAIELEGKFLAWIMRVFECDL
ncbi:MAG: hypothetical protein P1U34_12625 [Coxiellaceae bacterium]|nr:hypothetical protein [Coxiellaceae bacterium]